MKDRRRQARVSLMGRFARGRRLDRNPLRRRSDRAETAVLAALVAALAAGGPFAAMAAGAWEHAAAHREQSAQEASWRLVPAVVRGAPVVDPVRTGATAATGFEAPARWTAPDGTAVTGRIPVPADTTPGTTIRIWVARDGVLAGAPLRDSQVQAQAALAEVYGVAGTAVTVAVAGLLARRALDRRRLAAWDAEWRSVGPRWTTRA